MTLQVELSLLSSFQFSESACVDHGVCVGPAAGSSNGNLCERRDRSGVT
jgi:hypothetical protein